MKHDKKANRQENPVYSRLYRDYKLLQEKRIDAIGVFLNGSQNYCLNTEQSDIDTRAVILPSFYSLASASQPTSKEFVTSKNNEHITARDYRLVLSEFKKQNINAIEILFTKYSHINPKYLSCWNSLVADRELIAHYSPSCTFSSAMGQLRYLQKKLERSLEISTTSDAKISQEDAKIYSNVLRFNWFLNCYFGGSPYIRCITPEADVHDSIISLKNDRCDLTLKKAVLNTSRIVHSLSSIEMDKACKENKDTKNYVDNLFLDVSTTILKIQFKDAIKKGLI